MRKMILLAAMVAIAALMLAAAPALAAPQGKVTICHVPPGNPANAHEITISENAVERHLDNHPGDRRGSCDRDDGPRDGGGRDGGVNDGDRDGDGFFDFDEPFISQDFEQECESGDIDQSFDVSQTGDNSNQTVGIQGVANTGCAQTQLGVVDAGDFGAFDGNNDDERFFFVDNFCEFGEFDSDGDGICDRLDRLEERFEERCEDGNNDGFCDRLEERIEDLEDRIDEDGGFFFVDDDNDNDDRFFGGNDGSDFEFEDVGASIEVSPTNTVTSDQQVNQAATAFGK